MKNHFMYDTGNMEEIDSTMICIECDLSNCGGGQIPCVGKSRIVVVKNLGVKLDEREEGIGSLASARILTCFPLVSAALSHPPYVNAFL